MIDTMEKFTSDSEKQEWLYKAYDLFRQLVYGRLKLPEVKTVTRLIKNFSKRYDVTKDEIYTALYDNYIASHYYDKFNSHPDALVYFIIQYIREWLEDKESEWDKKMKSESRDKWNKILLEKSHEHTILNHAAVCFQRTISGYGILSINYEIWKKVETLMEKYGMCHDEIVSELFDEFLEKKVHLRYDPNRSSLRTFLLYYINNRLSNKIRDRKKFDKEINVKDFDYDAMSRAKGYPMSLIERLNASEAYNSVTPEKILIEKQLIEYLVKFLGEDDAKVFLGLESRKAEAERMGICYDAYCKRLRRKIIENLSEFEKAGYC